MGKYIIGLIALILVGSGAYYAVFVRGSAEPIDQATQPIQAATSTYATTTYSIVYPRDFTLDESYAYTGVPNKPIPGVKFTIPEHMATGTNLSLDSGVSVESLPRARSCRGDIYVLDNVRAETVTESGVEYSVASTSGAGAGNFYEETVYALTGSDPCIAVRYFIHSTNIGNYPEGTVREYDRGALMEAFDTIRRSLQLNALTP